MQRKPQLITVAGLVVFVVGVVAAFTAFAFSGPASAPGVAGGLLNIDSGSGDLSIGGTADGTSKLLIKSGGSTSGTFGLRVTDSGNNSLLIVRSDGVVTIASTTNVASAGIHFSDGTVQTSAYTGSVSNPVTIAGNVGAGSFGSNTGGGNYAFPANVNALDYQLGTWDALSYSGGVQLRIGNAAGWTSVVFPNGNVGVGTASPGQRLEVAGNTSSTQFCLGGSCIASWAGAGGGQWTTSGSNIYNANAGNVGIGTPGPGAKLDVNGLIRIGNPSGIYAAYSDAIYGTSNLHIAAATAVYINTANSAPTYINPVGGNVGIGTMGPTQKLDVNGTSVFRGQMTFSADNTYLIGADGANRPYGIRVATDIDIGTATHLSGTGVSYFNNGNVGIGTATPGHPLTVKGSYSPAQALVTADGTNGLFLAAAGASTFTNFLIGQQYNVANALEITPSSAVGGTTFATPALVVLGNGNVGIGTPSPTVKLEVGGRFRVADTPTINYGQAVIAIPRAKTTTDAQEANSALTLSTNETDYPFGAKFFVVGAASAANRYLSIQTGDHNLTNNGNIVLQASAGNVGIGKSNPGTALDVNGTVTAANVQVGASGYVGLNGGTTSGIGVLSSNRNSAVFDTVEAGGTDTLELNYYTGGAVVIGGAGGTKALYAGSYFGAGTGLTGTAASLTAGAAGNITAYTINQNLGTGNSPTFVKLTVGTVDPPYTIGGKQYATYLPGMTGQKEETTGIAKLTCSGNTCERTLAFGSAQEGSDLWLFAKTTDLKNHMGDMTVLLSPAFDGKAWYKKDAAGATLTILASADGLADGAEVSYHLIAPRFDSEKWTNTRNEPGVEGLKIEN